MKPRIIFIDFILKQWLIIVSGIALILTSLYTLHLPAYSMKEMEILFILFLMFVSVKGLCNSGMIFGIAKKIEKGQFVSLKLIVVTFCFSMLLTNDIALIILVPLTLSLKIRNKGIMVIFEAMAANAGSALTPFGNPQNLFIYWFYKIHFIAFIKTIAPFSIIFLIFLIVSSYFFNIGNNNQETTIQEINTNAYIFSGLFFWVLLIVLRIMPIATGIFIIIFILFIDRTAFNIDYSLLLTFFFFFGVAENIKIILEARIACSKHIFFFSALASQLMSNVPATLLFAKFTKNWEALLWGVNAGGFGSLFGSLANLIAYKIYITDKTTNDAHIFTAQFIIIGYIAFIMSIGLYFFIDKL